MSHACLRMALTGSLLALAAMAGSSARAETLAELDALSDASADEATGIASAQELAGRGLYLDALATLERVLAAFPESANARLIHALYLCRIDDPQGGLVEIDQLKKKQYEDGLLDLARQECRTPQAAATAGGGQ